MLTHTVPGSLLMRAVMAKRMHNQGTCDWTLAPRKDWSRWVVKLRYLPQHIYCGEKGCCSKKRSKEDRHLTQNPKIGLTTPKEFCSALTGDTTKSRSFSLID